jgi:hypothetical protein
MKKMVTTKLTLRLDDIMIRKVKKTESPVLYEVSGVLSGKHDAAKLRAEYWKRLAEKYR